METSSSAQLLIILASAVKNASGEFILGLGTRLLSGFPFDLEAPTRPESGIQSGRVVYVLLDKAGGKEIRAPDGPVEQA